MSEGFAAFVLLYMVFSMLFALMWVDSILNGRSFTNHANYIGFYRSSIKNKNAFGKTYVTIFYLIALPSYLFAMFGLYVFLVLQWIYDLGVKIDNEIEED